jgi:prepilin-type N-terminal cleavage/methylation domain-containing protein
VLANIKQERGFTLVELTVSLLITTILSTVFLTVFMNFMVIVNRNSKLVDMTVESQNLLRVMVEELRYGAGVRQTSTIADTNAPAGGWNTSNAAFVIITAVPAVDANNEHIINPDTGSPYMNEFVYYKQGITLYKRTLAHPDATGNITRTSCPAASATAGCPADKELIHYVNNMVFTLYDQDNGITTSPLLARSIKIDLTLQQNTLGGPLNLSNSIRVTLRNTF